ncbi:hypothetical protein ACH427_00115 [Streptomyces sp. NPDC020379]|uniref:hypothetical protein n=1 Tax=Streptomyces sp. NPDC020379 TaxID=3365071 RepID=UPI00378B7782
MSAGTKHRTHGPVQTKLPWWGLLLPAVAFVALFLVLASPASSEAHETSGAMASVARVADFVQRTLGG